MTITRLWQAGGEWNNVLVEFTSRSSANFLTSSTKARTGTYSIRTGTFNYYGTKVLDTTYTQLRLGAFINHNGADAGDSPSLFQFRSGSTVVVDLRWDGDNSTLKLYLNTTLVDSAVSAAFAATDTWLHIGIDAKINASGWVYVYLDGVEILSYEGDTTVGASSVGTIIVGSPTSSQYWSPYVYFDDIFVDSTAGEAAADVVPDYRFFPLTPNGNGFHNQWTGSDGNSTDNYLLVDEIPPDGDSTYVEHDISGENDSYLMSDITLEDGYEVSAVIPMAYAKKLNAGGSLNIKLTTRTTVSGSPYEASSAAAALGTDYSLVWERRALRPDGGAWDETTVNALDIGVEAS